MEARSMGSRMTRRHVFGTLALALAFALAETDVSGQTRVISRDEALTQAFAGAAIASERIFLTADQADRIADLGGAELQTRIYARYVATRDGTVIGRAYVDTHVVRTKRESLLVSLEADGRVRRIDVTAFLEPREYLAPEAWRRQYYGQGLGTDLAVGRSIRPMAGATLTTEAVQDAVRKILALDQVLNEQE